MWSDMLYSTNHDTWTWYIWFMIFGGLVLRSFWNVKKRRSHGLFVRVVDNHIFFPRVTAGQGIPYKHGLSIRNEQHHLREKLPMCLEEMYWRIKSLWMFFGIVVCGCHLLSLKMTVVVSVLNVVRHALLNKSGHLDMVQLIYGFWRPRFAFNLKREKMTFESTFRSRRR